MISLFPKKAPFNDIELLSLHLPKTGGISFLQSLRNQYGKGLLEIYSAALIRKINEGHLRKLPRRSVALHGHFQLNEFSRDIFPRARIICWLRHPVDRVISHYHFWQTFPAGENPIHRRFLQDKPDLKQFVSDPYYASSVNVYQSFLGPGDIDELFFVGRLEHYEQDLRNLARKMDWSPAGLFTGRENKGETENRPSAEIRKWLQPALEDEIELYNRLLARHHSSRS